MRHGLRQLASAHNAHRLLREHAAAGDAAGDAAARGLAVLSRALPFLLTYPFPGLPATQQALDCALQVLPPAPQDLQEHHLPQLSLLLTVLKAVLSRLGLTAALDGYCPSPQCLALLRRVFMTYTRLWTVVVERAEALHAASEEMYKYKVKVCKFEEDDDGFVRRLREMFPSYKEDFEEVRPGAPGGRCARGCGRSGVGCVGTRPARRRSRRGRGIGCGVLRTAFMFLKEVGQTGTMVRHKTQKRTKTLRSPPPITPPPPKVRSTKGTISLVPQQLPELRSAGRAAG